MEEYKGEPALDAGLLAAAQAVEHYEISRYGTLKSWAAKLNMKDAAKLLDQTLAEEKKTDDALTKLADTAVNAESRLIVGQLVHRRVRHARSKGSQSIAGAVGAMMNSMSDFDAWTAPPPARECHGCGRW